MPTVTQTLATLGLPPLHAQTEPAEPSPAPATDPDPNAKKTACALTPEELEAKVLDLETKVADLETRLAALETAKEPAAKTDPEPTADPKAAAFLKTLAALLQNPTLIQALAPGEPQNPDHNPAPAAPADLRAAYAALTNDQARADFLKLHWSERHSFIN